MEKCVNCGRSENEVRLFDGLGIGENVKICERCSLVGGIPVLKRPSTSQLRDSEKPYGVRERLSRMAHIQGEEKKEKSVTEQIRELEARPELEKPVSSDEELVFKLVDNFKWVIMTERRRKGISQKQLADNLGESASAIMMLEKGIVPSGSLNLIRGIEQLLKIRLIKRDFMEQVEEQRRRGAEAEKIIEKRMTEANLQHSSFVNSPWNKLPSKELPISMSRKESSSFKIGDLQRLSERIDKDFSYERKSKEEVGKEQTENTGGEDLEHLKKTVMKDSFRPKNPIPTIYDLMKTKEEKDRGVIGKDIEIVEEKKGNSSKPANWSELE